MYSTRYFSKGSFESWTTESTGQSYVTACASTNFYNRPIFKTDYLSNRRFCSRIDLFATKKRPLCMRRKCILKRFLSNSKYYRYIPDDINPPSNLIILITNLLLRFVETHNRNYNFLWK